MGYWDALKDTVSLIKDLSILEKIASKLIKKPDVAAEKLAVVLSELGKSYQALDDTLFISHHSHLKAMKTSTNQGVIYLKSKGEGSLLP